MAGTIIFNSIFVNSQRNNTGIFIGETAALGWDSHNKNQSSSGNVSNAFGGFSNQPGNLYLLSDNDVFDTFIADPDFEGGPTTQI